MRITISKNELSRCLSIVQSIVERKTTMPILTNVLLSASDGALKVAATDLEVTAVVNGKADVQSVGSTTVNGKVFGDIVKELPDGEVTIQVAEGERLEIFTGHSKLRVIGVCAEEYPSLPGIGIEVKGRMSAKEFDDMISKTLYAASVDEARFNLNGVCFEIVDAEKGKQKCLRMVSTDGHRLAMTTRPVKALEFPSRVIVPRKGLTEVKKLISSNEGGDIGLEISEGFFIVESGTAKLSMRLIDGEFPDYSQVLPKKDGTKVTINSNELSQALRRVSLLVTDKGKGVRFDFSPGALRISSSSPELGDASEELKSDYKGNPITVGFNARYLIDTLAAFGETGDVIIELNGDVGPGKISVPSDESSIAIVMPMRL